MIHPVRTETPPEHRDPNDPANYDPPASNFKFPVTSGRRFNMSWMDGRPWLRYSMETDRVYCIYWLCFGSDAHGNKKACHLPFVAERFFETGKKLSA